MEADQKKCTVCNEVKNRFTEFPKNGRTYRAHCKSCHSKQQMERYNSNRDNELEKKKQHYQINKDIILKRNKEYRNENADKINAQKAIYRANNRDEILRKQKTKDYKEKRNKRLQERRRTDTKFAMVNAYRARLNEVLHKQKKNTYIQYLNCKREEFLDWIEYQFSDKMNWSNYSQYWVIDHVVPIDAFDLTLEDHRYMCFSWFNLRPCNKKENSTKSNKIDEDVVQTQDKVLKKFKNTNNWYQADIVIYLWLRENLRYGNKPSRLGDSQPSTLPLE